MFQFPSVNVCICTSISWFFNKIDQTAFLELEKTFLQSFRSFFIKWSIAKVSRNNCAKLQVYVPQNIRKIYFLHKISRTRFWWKLFVLLYAPS